jgi:hypothetical protein
MFSFFKKTAKKAEFEEKVWTEKAYKYQAMYQDLKEITANGGKVLILTHFEKTFEEICFVLEQMQVSFYKFVKGDNTAILSLNQVAVFQADALYNANVQSLQAIFSQIHAQFFVIEHFPLKKNDDDLFETLLKIAPKAKVVFYTSLEDALLHQFVTENMKQMLEKLGHQPEESISHTMISKSIANAQEKIGKQARGSRQTYSAEEWFKTNL